MKKRLEFSIHRLLNYFRVLFFVLKNKKEFVKIKYYKVAKENPRANCNCKYVRQRGSLIMVWLVDYFNSMIMLQKSFLDLFS